MRLRLGQLAQSGAVDGQHAAWSDADDAWMPIDPPAGGGGGGSDLLAAVQYAPASFAEWTISSSTLTAIDTTNVTVTFTAPASGEVRITAVVPMFLAGGPGGAGLAWFDHGTSTVRGYAASLAPPNDYCPGNVVFSQILTGLTPTSSYQLDLAHCRVGAGTLHTYAEGNSALNVSGPLVIDVYAA